MKIIFVSLIVQLQAQIDWSQISWWLSIGVGLLIAGITLYAMCRSMKTARAKPGALDYLDKDSYDLYERHDYFLYSRITKQELPKNDNNK